MTNLEQSLAERGFAVTVTEGTSMQPMLSNGSRVVLVKPTFPLKKYDIPAYRRDDHYTLHRIVRVTKRGYVICGDNRADLERDITENDIIGVLHGYYDGDRFVSADSEECIAYGVRAWRRFPLRFLRRIVRGVIRKTKALFGAKTEGS